MYFRTIFMVLIFAVCACPVFAGDYGVIGDKLLPAIKKALGTNSDLMTYAATAVLAIAGFVFNIIFRMINKKVPTAMQGIFSTIYWKLAAACGGSGVILENNYDMEYVKNELAKKYPALEIKLKSESNVAKAIRNSPIVNSAENAMDKMVDGAMNHPNKEDI